MEVAIKQYDRNKLYLDTMRVQALKREVQILKSLSNEGIMKFIDLIDSGNKVNIILEYINGNNLYQYIRKNHGSRIQDENEVKDIFFKILKSVKYIHD
jgi:serine/threonine protein kinase